MATTNGTAITDSANGGCVVATWSAVPNGNQGSWAPVGQFSDLSVQIEGTFGVGGSVSIEGTNDGTNPETLADQLGNALTFTAKGLKKVGPLPLKIRPNVTAGDGTTALTVTVVGRLNRT